LRAVINPGEHDEGGDGLHVEGERQEHGDGGQRADTGQNADERADQNADEAVDEVLQGECDAEAEGEVLEQLHRVQEPGSSR
jgi:hypothetical protein